MRIELLLAFGASTRGVTRLRDQLGITTLTHLGEFVRDYRLAKARNPRAGYQFHTYLACEHVGRNTGNQLLKAYERWEKSVLHQQDSQNQPHAAMV